DLLVGRARFKMTRKAELDAGLGQTGCRGQQASGFAPKWIVGIDQTARGGEDGAHAPSALFCRRLARAHGDARSSSIASEHPRGGAPGDRPKSSTLSPAHRPRSAVCTAMAPSTLARSSKRKMPVS